MQPKFFLMAYLAFWLAVLGSVAGSAIDCAACRYAAGQPLPTGRSRCDSCGHTLGAADLVPIFSYLFHRGRCRHCGAKIPPECLVAELLGAVLFVALGLRYGLQWQLVMWLILCVLLLLLSFIDAKTHLLPDVLLLAAVVNRLVFLFVLRQPLGTTLPQMLLGAVSVSVPLLGLVLLMDKLLGKESMGGGDIKLLFVMGLYASWMQMLLVLFVACLLGLVWAAAAKKQAAIAFGPFLALAFGIVLLFGDGFIAWYQQLLT